VLLDDLGANLCHRRWSRAMSGTQMSERDSARADGSTKRLERIAAAHYLGRTYDATTEAEGVGVAIAFLVLSAVFLAFGIRRALVARRAPRPRRRHQALRAKPESARTYEGGRGSTVAETVIV
jgi:hypothetical protein